MHYAKTQVQMVLNYHHRLMILTLVASHRRKLPLLLYVCCLVLDN